MKYTIADPKPSLLENLLAGFQTLVVVQPQQVKSWNERVLKPHLGDEESDAQALMSDWEAVGDVLWSAIDESQESAQR